MFWRYYEWRSAMTDARPLEHGKMLRENGDAVIRKPALMKWRSFKNKRICWHKYTPTAVPW